MSVRELMSRTWAKFIFLAQLSELIFKNYILLPNFSSSLFYILKSICLLCFFQIIKNTLDPAWPSFDLAVNTLCNGDYNRPIKVSKLFFNLLPYTTTACINFKTNCLSLKIKYLWFQILLFMLLVAMALH